CSQGKHLTTVTTTTNDSCFSRVICHLLNIGTLLWLSNSEPKWPHGAGHSSSSLRVSDSTGRLGPAVNTTGTDK
ncbi:uncharacterized, partial [Tachysurus ichikawai]